MVSDRIGAENALRMQVEWLQASLNAEREKAAHLERERDEALAHLDEAQRERDALAAQLAALRDCDSAGGTTVAGPCGACVRCLRDGRASAHARASLVEAQIAALREAGRVSMTCGCSGASGCPWTALHVALADTAHAAEAYTRRVQVDALESTVVCMRDHVEAMAPGDLRTGVDMAAGMVAARAAKIRGGR